MPSRAVSKALSLPPARVFGGAASSSAILAGEMEVGNEQVFNHVVGRLSSAHDRDWEPRIRSVVLLRGANLESGRDPEFGL